MKFKISRFMFALGIIASLSLGATAAVAVQGASSNLNSAPAPEYERNESGLTFGSAAEAISRETEPDLISAVGDDGTKGYVFAKDLHYQPEFKNPSEVIAWQKAHAGRSWTIDLFAVDGKQKIGVFTLSVPTDEQIKGAEKKGR
ncbi:peptidase M56 BlaR1 [Pseudarthrobacter phenanthrenivorans]|nr:peptidase M56 BlaR1 [Pseudarthrobacter phenanthrenivorans]